MDKLGGINLDALGTLDPDQGGLGTDMWRGTTQAEVAALLQAMPAAIPSPALRGLARRLLLSTAEPPGGPKAQGPSLLTLRAEKLSQMGDVDDARALAGMVPSSVNDEALARIRMDAKLIAGDTNGACADAGDALRQYPGVYWQKVQIFCEALAHKGDQVDIGVGLLHDQGADKDQAFFTLVAALTGTKTAKVKSLPEATPLHLAMMRAANQPLPDDLLRSSDPALLRAVADSPNTSAELRLEAAERAMLLGALAPDALAAIYDKVPVSEADIQAAMSKAQSQYGPRTRVLLYRAAKVAKTSEERARLVQTALLLARKAGVYGLAVGVNLPIVDPLSPSPSLAFFAPEAARAYYYAGRMGVAQSWHSLAQQQSASKPEAGASAVELWPYGILTSADWENGRFSAWQMLEAKKEPDPKRAAAQTGRLLALFDALGRAVPDSAWQPIYAAAAGETAGMPSVALWRGVKAAAAAGRKGETALLMLVAVGAEGSNPIAIDRAVEALRQVGLKAEARQLAIEAAIADGV